jgi:hypothetical protein
MTSGATEIDDLVEWWSVAAWRVRSQVDQSDNPFRSSFVMVAWTWRRHALEHELPN